MNTRPTVCAPVPLLAVLALGCASEEVDIDFSGEPEQPHELRDIIDIPALEIHPPIRVEDLTRNQLMRISDSLGGWHDFKLIDWQGSWSFYNPGYSPVGNAENDEPNEGGWGLPIYAGISGEVISCWRGLAFDTNWDSTISVRSGNFVTIMRDDGVTFLAAHLITGTIPSWICPNSPEPTLPDGSPNTAGGMQNPSNDYPGSNIPAEAYVEPAQRVFVDAGDYLGRMGAHGNAGGTHTHVTLGLAETINGVERHVFRDPVNESGLAHYHVGFEHAYMRVSEPGVMPNDPWTATSGRDIPEASEFDNLMIWPSPKRRETYSGSYHLGDYNLDGRDDLLCNSVATGRLWVDLASPSGDFGATDQDANTNFCKLPGDRLFTTDVDGDGRQDVVCHNYDSGLTSWDLATGNANFTGAQGWTQVPFCNGATQNIHFGDFDNDGSIDRLCHDFGTGARYVDLRSNGWLGTDESRVSPWCQKRWQRLHVGDLGGGQADDMLCHDTRSGTVSIDRSGGAGNVLGATDETRTPWCQGGGTQLFLADLNGGGIEELVCFDRDNGRFWVDRPNGPVGARYGTTDWSGPANDWCTGPYDTLRFGDVNGDGSEDAVCFSHETGQRWIDYSEASGLDNAEFLNGTDETAGTWCQFSTQGLH